MNAIEFVIHKPVFDAANGRITLSYGLGELQFTETLDLPAGYDLDAAKSPAFFYLLDLTAVVLGTSYFKLLAPLKIAAPELKFNETDIAFLHDVYENGLAEFYARNDLKRFGKLNIVAGAKPVAAPPPRLKARTLLPIGGGKDSLVSVQLLEKTGTDFTPFAVNPKGPIVTSVNTIGRDPLYVARTLDPDMIRLGKQPGYYNGHVPSTAINSMIAALVAILFSYESIALSNERSASEGNMEFDGRVVNHQHSKSLDFEKLLAATLNRATGGALTYFSLLRPFSEARIAALFARETKFDSVFSSCNRNFRLAGHEGDLWCGTCPKCLFTFLILAPHMSKERLTNVFSQNVLENAENENGFRELTGLAGQKPWECVGEILEAAACLFQLTKHAEWSDATLIKMLLPDLENQYGINTLEDAYADLQNDRDEHFIPAELMQKVAQNAL